MDEKKIRSIKIPFGVRMGIQKLKSGYRGVNIGGIDTETVKENLFSIQIASENRSVFQLARGFKTGAILDFIMDSMPRGNSVLFAHNLSFELTSMFHKLIEHPTSEVAGYKIKLLPSSPAYMRISDCHNKTVELMDSFMYFQSGLENVAKKYNLAVKKLSRPAYLGLREPTESEMPYFQKYAMTDAVIAHMLGQRILEMHKVWDVDIRGTVSPATLSSKIERRKYINYIPYPPNNVNHMAMRSYYGGRTEALIYGTEQCQIYDFHSHYPAIASEIAVPLEQDKWKFVRSFEGIDGFYLMSGHISCDMKLSPLTMKLNNLAFPTGTYKNMYVCGAEAKLLMEYGRVDSIKGWIYTGERGTFLADFVHDVYKLKESADKSSVEYLLYKLLLTCGAYGKFCQLNPTDNYGRNSTVIVYDDDSEKMASLKRRVKFIAGGLFNPPIAAFISGTGRAKIFSEAIKYADDVLYMDTDSLFLRDGTKVKTGSKLGELGFEGEGKATIIREKLYYLEKHGEVFKSGTHACWKRSQLTDDEKDRKVDSKGKALRNIVHSGIDTYEIDHMIRSKEAIRRHITPLMMEKQKRKIDLSPSHKRDVPVTWKNTKITEESIDLPAIHLGGS